MCGDWEDIPKLTEMTYMVMGIKYAKQVPDCDYEFPAVLAQMICHAAGTLADMGCRREDISKIISSRIAAMSERISVDTSGYKCDTVINSTKFHRAVLNCLHINLDISQ
jgi:hypothetical protein